MAGYRLTVVLNAAETPGFLPDLDYERLKALVILRTGHHYYQDKDDLLWERLRRRWRSLGLPGAAGYLALLGDPLRGEAEWSVLEAEITIGETFFFRYAEQFVALRDHILPNLIARAQATRRLRFWSAGCANGAEPYSLAILLREKLGDTLPDWRIHLIGTDINEAVLETARRAEFGHWALRTLTAEELARDFTPGREGRWALRPQHRGQVRFTRHNLLSLLDGTSPLQFNEFDLILCRNVLIYFHPDMVQRVVRALCDRLTPGGWLLLGHAEPNPTFQTFMEVVQLPGTVAYRRPMEPLPLAAATAVPWQPGLPPPASSTWPLPPPPSPSAAAPRPAVARRPPPTPPRVAAPSPGVREAVRVLANRGDLGGARQACQQGLQNNPVDAGLHFYAAMVARALGEAAAAEQAFRRALYLDGGFVMAHYQLGLLLLDQGQREAGRRALANASRIAQHLPDRSALEEGDGMTAKELRDSVRLQLETIATPPVRS
jgi:chemotaxis protein methyltransferase CheR